MLEEAILLATDCFVGKFDKAGKPAILHSLAVLVALRNESEDVQSAGVLHDTIEDGSLESGDIFQLFSDRVFELVVLMTRKSGEDYQDYIRRVARDPDARRIKRADIADNLSRPSPSELHEELVVKYAKAEDILSEYDKCP